MAFVPVLFLFGDKGSAKTTTVVKSGLDPELLAGTAGAATGQVSTEVLNLWFGPARASQ